MVDAANTVSEYHVAVTDESQTAVDLLAPATSLSKQRIKQAMQKGAVWVTHLKRTSRLRRATKTLHKGDELHLYFNKNLLDSEPPTPMLIADKGGYSIWNKPCGMLCQGSKWSDHHTINRWVESHGLPNRPAIIQHRLDRATRGLIILSHNRETSKQFSRLFENRAITKHYQAIVSGKILLESDYLTVESPIDSRRAVSHIRSLDYNANRNESLLSVEIETGRKHQIRRHLSQIGHPIIGDRLYGQPESDLDLQLAACSLSFNCPIDNIQVEYRLPKQLTLPWS